MKRFWMCCVLSVCLGCGGEAADDDNGGTLNVMTVNNDGPACDDVPAGGQTCSGFSDCPDVPCQCTNGSVISSRSCSNGVCLGGAACEEVCANDGAADACASANNDESNDPMSNETPNNETPNNDGPTCDQDLSQFADWDWGYDVECLEQNCCEQAAYCATFASCRAYDDCLLPCFSNGTADQDCIRTCKEQNATPDFLDDAYAPFATCAITNGCP